jgi:hypothetical protein
MSITTAVVFYPRKGYGYANEISSGRPKFVRAVIIPTLSSRRYRKQTKSARLLGICAFGLEEIARYTTFRETWRADNKFKVVLNKTNFDHIVGEVELQRAVTLDNNGGEDVWAAIKQALIADMDQQLEDFMNYYSWAFPSERPVGKLSAYFIWKRKRA